MGYQKQLENRMWASLKYSIPRILGQLNRDEDSPTFGSFDRNYWHYKIRDFSSMILQQGAIVLQTLYHWQHPENELYGNANVDKWIKGAIDFWCHEQLKNGSFNEYYPFESGYPPTAFGLYTIGLLYQSETLGEPSDKVKKAIQKSVNWLLDHPEKEALNQESAGLAGIALVRKLSGIKVDQVRYEKRLKLFFEAQSVEGWFPEYGGPDIGYLSVTLDCLVDYYEATKDQRALAACNKAVGFISDWVTVSNETPVMINARNTNYIVPYGLIKLGKDNPLAASIVNRLFTTIDQSKHYIHHIDDRYACHYVFQSLFRGLTYLNKMTDQKGSLNCEKNNTTFYPHCGIYIEHRKDSGSIFISARKGGIVYTYSTQGLQNADFGWRYRTGKTKIACTHWHDEHYKIDVKQENEITVLVVKGSMTNHGWLQATPVKHIVLRMISYVMGNRLIPLLKNIMIFGKKPAGIEFERVITINKKTLMIKDVMTKPGLNPNRLYIAPHTSMRHVASAGQFIEEELMIVKERSIVFKENTAVSECSLLLGK